MDIVDKIFENLARKGDAMYGGEAVTQLQHALQCAELARQAGAGDALVGALTLALSRGDAPEEALRWGVAAAAALTLAGLGAVGMVEARGRAVAEAERTKVLRLSDDKRLDDLLAEEEDRGNGSSEGEDWEAGFWSPDHEENDRFN